MRKTNKQYEQNRTGTQVSLRLDDELLSMLNEMIKPPHKKRSYWIRRSIKYFYKNKYLLMKGLNNG